MAAEKTTIWDQMCSMQPLVECWSCKQMKRCLSSINITAGAAGSVPSTFKPICDDCAATAWKDAQSA